MGSPGTTPLGASRADLAGNRAVGCAGDSHQHARAGEASPVDNSLLYGDVDLAAMGCGDSFDRSDGTPVSAAEVADGTTVGRARRFDRWHDANHVGVDGSTGCYVESHAAGFRGGAVRAAFSDETGEQRSGGAVALCLRARHQHGPRFASAAGTAADRNRAAQRATLEGAARSAPETDRAA